MVSIEKRRKEAYHQCIGNKHLALAAKTIGDTAHARFYARRALFFKNDYNRLKKVKKMECILEINDEYIREEEIPDIREYYEKYYGSR